MTDMQVSPLQLDGGVLFNKGEAVVCSECGYETTLECNILLMPMEAIVCHDCAYKIESGEI